MDGPPACHLEGTDLNNGWTVAELLTTELHSGGNHCYRYNAIHISGQTGFLKAMDLSWARTQPDWLQAINDLSAEFLHERKLVGLCKDRKFSRVIMPLASGEVSVPLFRPPEDRVTYIIFEMAEHGDLNESHTRTNDTILLSCARVMHSTALALRQLQSAQIAHHDIKPSNVLSFNKTLHKVSDLGRSSTPLLPSKWDKHSFTGDPGYQPPEAAFRVQANDDWDRMAIDIFMLGSLHYQLITGVQIGQPLITRALKIEPGLYDIGFNEALPYLQSALNHVLELLRENHFTDTTLANAHVSILAELCKPDPSKRGYCGKLRKPQRLSADRYVGKYAELIRRTIMINGDR